MNTFQIVFKSKTLIFLYCMLLKIAVLCDNILQLCHVFPEKVFHELGSLSLFSELTASKAPLIAGLLQEQTPEQILIE